MDFIAQLKAQVDIVGVIQEYVRLKKAGAIAKEHGVYRPPGGERRRAPDDG